MRKAIAVVLILSIAVALFAVAPQIAFAEDEELIKYQEIQRKIENREYDCYTDFNSLYDAENGQNFIK